jgi:hypothetical protein
VNPIVLCSGPSNKSIDRTLHHHFVRRHFHSQSIATTSGALESRSLHLNLFDFLVISYFLIPARRCLDSTWIPPQVNSFSLSLSL